MVNTILTYIGAGIMVLGILTTVYYGGKELIQSFKAWRLSHGTRM